ncbi:hypothetical protein [Luteolibacter sp. Populi]|uniref:hypothetical protein n=1 Tax=Luteolibacter sp. Populi TaxID=3230487 RepID=UPI00346753C2
MPHRFRTTDGKIYGPGSKTPFPVSLPDGAEAEVIWGGCAQHEKLGWWLRKPGHAIAQSAQEVAAIAIQAEDTKEFIWGDAPPGARLIWVLEPPVVSRAGSSYQLAKMVTVEATPAQLAYFRDTRFALLGSLDPAGKITAIPALEPPPARPPAQGELF